MLLTPACHSGYLQHKLTLHTVVAPEHYVATPLLHFSSNEDLPQKHYNSPSMRYRFALAEPGVVAQNLACSQAVPAGSSLCKALSETGAAFSSPAKTLTIDAAVKPVCKTSGSIDGTQGT